MVTATAQRNLNSISQQPVLPVALRDLRVAIVHYWFVGRAGGELVVEALADIFPQADLFALIAQPETMSPELRKRKLTTSFLQRIPFVHRFHRHTLALQPFALEQFDLSEYDLVISSESGPAKGVLTSPWTLHVCYCHSPMRYIWDMYPKYVKGMSFFTKAVFALVAHFIRVWDHVSAARVDEFLSNSEFVAKRIRSHYRREATVIHPPVQVASAVISAMQDDYYLLLGRFVDYKRFDLAIAACTKLGKHLKVIGSGPQAKALKRIAGPTVEFLGALTDAEKNQQIAHCKALLFPGEEDFGIVPVEVQAFGRPVIAYGSGGALESVCGIFAASPIPASPTGVFFKEQTVDSLAEAIEFFEQTQECFHPEEIRAHAMQFDEVVFRKKIIEYLTDKISEHNKNK